jgi:hypothetical protein
VFGPTAWFHVLLALKVTLKCSALLNRVVRFNIVLHAFKPPQNFTVAVKEGMNLQTSDWSCKPLKMDFNKKWATVSKL